MEIMKKKKSEIHNKDQQHQIPRSSLRSLNQELRMSSNGFNSRVSRERADMRRVKRVRFADPDSDPFSCIPDPCSLPAKGTLPPSFEEPKTSEYAFYKRLRKDAGRSCHPYPRNKQDNPLEKFEASNSAGELTNKAKPDLGIRFLLPVEKVTPAKLKSSHSPRGDSRNSGSHSRNLEVFSTKRQKLLQWALETSSIDSSQCHSNGYDLVSVLLRRLVPESNAIASSSCMEQRIRRPKLNTKSQLPASPESDIHIKELPNMNFISPIVGRYIENGSSDCWSNKSREIIFSQLDNVDADSPGTVHANNFHLQYQKRHSDNFVEDGRTTDLQIKRELAFEADNLGTEFSFKGCEYLALPMQSRLDFSIHENLSSSWDYSEKSLGFSDMSSFKELDELHDPNEPVLGSSHLLGWDDNNLENEKDFSSHSLSAVLNLNPTSSTSSGDDNWKTLNNKFDKTGLHSSSALAIHQYPDYPLLDFCSESYPVHAFASHVLEDREYQVVVSDHFPLNLSSSPILAQNSRLSDDYKWRSILHSPNGNFRFMSKVFREIILPSSKTLQLPSGVNFDLGLKGLPVIDSFEEYHSSNQSDLQVLMKDMKGLCSSTLTGNINNRCLDSSSHTPTHAQFDEDIFNSHDYSSMGFKISLNKELVYPLLLDNSSWDRSVEISRDYSEDE